MSVRSEITRIKNGMEDLTSAIEEKGVTVEEGTRINEMGDKVRAIAVGEENIIEEVLVNGTALPVTDKAVNIDLSGYASGNDLYNLQQTVNSIRTGVENLSNNLFNLVYPVGAIYISYNKTSPATLFSGTWTFIASKFLYSASSATATLGTGGATTHSHDVSSAIAQILLTWKTFGTGDLSTTGFDRLVFNNDSSVTFTPNKTTKTGASQLSYTTAAGTSLSTTGIPLKGSTKTASSLPPYQQVYMWRRTA